MEEIIAKPESDLQKSNQKGAKRRKRTAINQLPSRRSSRHVGSNVDFSTTASSKSKQTADEDDDFDDEHSKEESNLTKIKEKDVVMEEQLNEPLVIPVEEEVEKINGNPIPNMENKMPTKSQDDVDNSEMKIESETPKKSSSSNLVVSSENVTMEIITDIEIMPKPKKRGRKRTKNNSNEEEEARGKK